MISPPSGVSGGTAADHRFQGREISTMVSIAHQVSIVMATSSMYQARVEAQRQTLDMHLYYLPTDLSLNARLPAPISRHSPFLTFYLLSLISNIINCASGPHRQIHADM